MKEYIGFEDNGDFISEGMLCHRYGFTKEFLEKYFPVPHSFRNKEKGKKSLQAWPTRIVEERLLDRKVQEAFEKLNAPNSPEMKEVRGFFKEYNLDMLSQNASNPSRKFVLHVGPTNSGKTYNALQCLKHAENGVYLGPLRLLALEVFETLNLDGCPCSLLTGEESEEIPFAKHTASTIELCDFRTHYKVAVIDEAQLIADPLRGGHWTNALFRIDADEVHVCLAPEAEDLIIHMIKIMGCSYTVNRCKRKTPLVFSGVLKDLQSVQAGDALIAFSRRAVLAIAAALEELGIRTSVLYGSLPPKARRNEVEKFVNGQSTVIVATDAIGMGVSLPIKRVIFCEIQKFDGRHFRRIQNHEVKQIAGRAGRFGKYPKGEVLTMVDPEYIENALEAPSRTIKKYTLPFPTQILDTTDDLEMVLSEWERLLPCEGFRRESKGTELYLYRHLKKDFKNKKKSFQSDANLFKCISAPFDTRSNALLGYWTDSVTGILNGKDKIPYPAFGCDTLEKCELQYRSLDLRHYFIRCFHLPCQEGDEKNLLCQEINQFLLNDKDRYFIKCTRCGKRLEFSEKSNFCDDCYTIVTAETLQRQRAKKKARGKYNYLKRN